MTSDEIRKQANELRDRLVSLYRDMEIFRSAIEREKALKHLGTQTDLVERVASPQMALDDARESLGHVSARLIEARAHMACASANLESLGR